MACVAAMLTKGYTRSGNKCICDSSKRFYRTGKTCTECPANKEFNNLLRHMAVCWLSSGTNS